MRRRVFAWLPVALCMMAAPALAGTFVVKADQTPLRSAPALSAPVVAELKAGTVLEILSVKSGWYRVRDRVTRKEGYLPATAVTVKPDPAEAAPGRAATGAAPATQAPIAPAPIKTTARRRRAPRPPKKGDWTDRGYLFVSGLLETGGSAVTESQSWPSFAETATATAAFPAKSAAGFDASGGYRIWRNLAVGAGVTIVSRSTTAAYSGSIPNPLYLNRPNQVSGTFPVSASETAINLQAAWGIPVSPKMLVVLFAGPSIFSVKQTLMQPMGLSIPAGYPYDSTTATVSVADMSKTAWGFGVGADLSYYFSKTVGVGGMIRFARATADFPISGQPSVGVTAGGFQVGGGLRFRFAAPKPKPAQPVTPAPKPPLKKK